ncbi:MAG: hypothetical protein B6D38_09295 [Anaerolineae bacterium UTCFX1]|nr:MAG: hypothetical protein B6D38_09295 [Anaerolineae bacterium UTCFX1]
MKRTMPFILILFLLSSCNGWIIQPLPGNAPTPFTFPTQAPYIFTPTPVVIGAYTATSSPIPNTATPTALPFDTPSVTPFTPPTDTAEVPTLTPIFIPSASPPPSASIMLVILGCKTSVDILHGMGEVTDAYIVVKNTGGMPLTNINVTLFALDPGAQQHPDQTARIDILPIKFQTPLKLTVDTTYKQATPIQVEVYSDQGLFPREGAASCADIGLFTPIPSGLKTPAPIPP